MITYIRHAPPPSSPITVVISPIVKVKVVIVFLVLLFTPILQDIFGLSNLLQESHRLIFIQLRHKNAVYKLNWIEFPDNTAGTCQLRLSQLSRHTYMNWVNLSPLGIILRNLF